MLMSIELREVTRDTVREVCALEVREDQKSYVTTNALSIAQAHFEPTAVYRAVYLGDRPIGFVLWRNAGSASTVVLWRFMIAQEHQLGPSSPLKFYLSQGFVEAKQTTPRGEWLLWMLL